MTVALSQIKWHQSSMFSIIPDLIESTWPKASSIIKVGEWIALSLIKTWNFILFEDKIKLQEDKNENFQLSVSLYPNKNYIRKTRVGFDSAPLQRTLSSPCLSLISILKCDSGPTQAFFMGFPSFLFLLLCCWGGSFETSSQVGQAWFKVRV